MLFFDLRRVRRALRGVTSDTYDHKIQCGANKFIKVAVREGVPEFTIHVKSGNRWRYTRYIFTSQEQKRCTEVRSGTYPIYWSK